MTLRPSVQLAPSSIAICALLLAGCPGEEVEPDAGSTAADATPVDVVPPVDAAADDVSTTPDVSPQPDATRPDTAQPDSAQPDTTPAVDAAIEGDAGGPPTGTASLSFEPRWGPDYNNQFEASWRPSIPGFDGDSTLLIMLCETADASCESPVLIHEVGPTETDGNPIQSSFGPAITVGGLPAGTFGLMIIADSTDSRALGYGWDDAFVTKETAWAGVVSEADHMASADGDTPATAHNPAPHVRSITLVDDQTNDAGVIPLAHYHQRDISPDPVVESGLMVVASPSGVRVIDLTTSLVRPTTVGGAVYEHVMVDGDGQPVAGTVCGMVRGPGATVLVLFEGSSGEVGFAVPFDPGAGAQLYGGNRVLFTDSEFKRPCRGLSHSAAGTDYLWVSNATASLGAAAGDGMWYADISELNAGDVVATHLDAGDDTLFGEGVDGFAVRGSTLYLSVTPDALHPVQPCGSADNRHCAFKASFDATGAPTLLKNGEVYDALEGPQVGASYTRAGQPVDCADGAPGAGVAVAHFHDGRDLLFIGGCLEFAVFDLNDAEQRLDFNGAEAGEPNFDATLYGNGFASFSLSPDGSTLWAAPQNKSGFMHYFEKTFGSGDRQTYNRFMLFPIDLTAGALPAVRADLAVDDIDGHAGPTDLSDLQTPAIDPGLDINVAHANRYIVGWAASLAGTTFGSAAYPFHPDIAAANGTVWVHGSGVDGVSGLGKAGNLIVSSVVDREMILWPRGEDPFYPIWTTGLDGDYPLGFDLTPENSETMSVCGLVFVPVS